MSLKSLFYKPAIILIPTLVLSVALPALATFAALGIGSRDDFEDYRSIRHHHPIALELWDGTVAPRQDARSLFRRHKPHAIRVHGPYTLAHYYPGGPLRPGPVALELTCVIAKDGRLVVASSGGCIFERTYFDTMTPADNTELSRLMRRSMAERSDDPARNLFADPFTTRPPPPTPPPAGPPPRPSPPSPSAPPAGPDSASAAPAAPGP